jgi:DNA-binding transcriptional ArsR family regulator
VRERTDSPLDPGMAKAMSHPLRQKILQGLNERVASPSQLARELGDPLPKVAYHVKVLLEHGAVELVETKTTGPSIEHFYRATTRVLFDDEHWSQLPLSIRRSLFDHTLEQTWQHLVDAAREGGFDEPRTHITWSAHDLDEETYQEMVDLLAETLERAMEIQAKAAGKRAEDPSAPDPEHKTELCIQYFHRAESAEAGTRRKRAGAKA